MDSLNNVTTANTYTAANTRELEGVVFVDFVVSGNNIAWSFKRIDRVWSEDFFMPQTQRGMRLNCRGIRVRSWVAGQPATVTVYLKTMQDVGELPP